MVILYCLSSDKKRLRIYGDNIVECNRADEREVVIAMRDQVLARRTHSDLEIELCQATVRLAASTGGGWGK